MASNDNNDKNQVIFSPGSFYSRLFKNAINQDDVLLALLQSGKVNDSERLQIAVQSNELKLKTCFSCFCSRSKESFLRSRIRPRYPMTLLIKKLLARQKRGKKLTRNERRRIKSFQKSRALLIIPCTSCARKPTSNAKLELSDLNKTKMPSVAVRKANTVPPSQPKIDLHSVVKPAAKKVSGPSELKKTVEKRRNFLNKQLINSNKGGSVLQSFLEGLKK